MHFLPRLLQRLLLLRALLGLSRFFWYQVLFRTTHTREHHGFRTAAAAAALFHSTPGGTCLPACLHTNSRNHVCEVSNDAQVDGSTHSMIRSNAETEATILYVPLPFWFARSGTAKENYMLLSRIPPAVLAHSRTQRFTFAVQSFGGTQTPCGTQRRSPPSSGCSSHLQQQ